MKLFGRDLDSEVVVVAEIGVNHEGDLNAARAIVEAVGVTGADAIKLQSYTPARYASSSDPERLKRVTRFALDENAHRELAKVAKERGITLFSTAVTEDWVPFLSAQFPAVKIASGDLTFAPVITAAARSGKPVILSTGCGTLEEIDRAVEWVKAEVGAAALPERLVLLHCVAAYPVPIEQANVLSVPFLRERYRVPVGFSNHVIGPEAIYAAVALGACVIELHVTDRREGRTFRDHALSMEPAELAALVTTVRAIKTSLGKSGKTVQASELALRDAIRKGVVAARDLPAATSLRDDDLMYARPATEFTALERPSLVGRKLSVGLKAGELIKRSAVD
ncbi:MAG: N-acetylneuraminate synthase family protein [Xanthobacteraceae bacterium]|nr:N-acetylneuraminate synthase family protein [Xanthobacteraceae bacterium]